MIFGFNTDVRYGDTLYHVMTEPRPDDLLFQTMIFLRGRCIGKRAWSYAAHSLRPGFTEAQMHELLRDQHRRVLEGIRDGKVGGIFGDETEVADVGGELGLKCLNLDSIYAESGLLLKLQVTCQGRAVEGARVACRVGEAIHAETTSGLSGHAELRLPLERVLPGDLALWVEAALDQQSVTRKLRLRKSG